jgi:carbamoyltransferase
VRICGLKLTHDGAVAVIEDGRLVFSVEMEKCGNRARYSALERLEDAEDVLQSFALGPSDLGCFVVDGWGGAQCGAVRFGFRGREHWIAVAGYDEQASRGQPLDQFGGSGLPFADSYSSFQHAAGHLIGAYCTSPFARRAEPSWVLVWDGGMLPRLYRVAPDTRAVNAHGPIHRLYGNIYALYAQFFEPFRREESRIADDSALAGKVMAYVAKGRAEPEIIAHLSRSYAELRDVDMESALWLGKRARGFADRSGASDADMLASLHTWVEQLTVRSLAEALDALGEQEPVDLCFAGGCALNIKWNSALRASGRIRELWVPPFANDSGSALGAACCAMFTQGGPLALDWDVYAGPPLIASTAPDGWRGTPCPIENLAQFLAEHAEPVVFLHGRAEIGPRALGHRSILAAAQRPEMRDELNRLKGREEYRPVAPICLEDRASQVFEPGGADPYMLFEHRVRPDWVGRVPAVVHLDGSARLQTVNPRQEPEVAALLRAYESRTGIPLLCNTSANLAGCGFFPDAASAMSWGGTNYVWAEGVLFARL